MAIKVMTQVWENGPQDKMERFVLLALADHCNDEGHCYPSLDLLQKKCLLTRQGLCNVIDRLEQKGYIVRQRGGGKGNPTNYWIQLDSLRPQPKSQVDKSQVDQSNSQVDTRKSQADQEKESSWLDGNRQGTTKEPSKKRESAPAREEALSVIDDYFKASPKPFQRDKITAIVDDLDRWRAVLEDLATRGYSGSRAVGYAIKNYENPKPTHKEKTNGRTERAGRTHSNSDSGWEGFIGA